jgi:hypothetical protein
VIRYFICDLGDFGRDLDQRRRRGLRAIEYICRERTEGAIEKLPASLSQVSSMWCTLCISHLAQCAFMNAEGVTPAQSGCQYLVHK